MTYQEDYSYGMQTLADIESVEGGTQSRKSTATHEML